MPLLAACGLQGETAAVEAGAAAFVANPWMIDGLGFEQGFETFDDSMARWHATGTAVGDAVEIAGLGRVFAGGRCAIGSVKSMIGHAKAAAGLAGLVKAALAVHQGVLPPSIHVEAPNEALQEADGALYVITDSDNGQVIRATPIGEPE